MVRVRTTNKLTALDRDLMAERVATVLRHGATRKEICQRFGISSGVIASLGRDYGFSVPGRHEEIALDPDDPGEYGAPPMSAFEVWERARLAAARQRIENGDRSYDALIWPDTPEAVFYDDCAPSPVATTAADVIRQVCEAHRISRDALLGPLRKAELVAARQEACFRLIVEIGLSYPQAGRIIGRDHTTVLHSVRRHMQNSIPARLAYRAFIAANRDRTEDAKAMAIRLHFEEGYSIQRLSRELPIAKARLTITGWLLEEAKRRGMREAA